MREIKFRVFKTFGFPGMKMDYNPVIYKGMYCDMDGSLICDTYESDTAIVMQNTGLKDANGKEIYESDIVKTTNFIHMKTIYEIIWNEEVASFEYKDGPYINEYGDIIPGIHYPNECIVIGNIYENPELLDPNKIDFMEQERRRIEGHYESKSDIIKK